MTEIEAFLSGIYLGIAFIFIAGISFGIYKLASNIGKSNIRARIETGIKFGLNLIPTNLTCSILILLGLFGSAFACIIIIATENPK